MLGICIVTTSRPYVPSEQEPFACTITHHLAFLQLCQFGRMYIVFSSFSDQLHVSSRRFIFINLSSCKLSMQSQCMRLTIEINYIHNQRFNRLPERPQHILNPPSMISPLQHFIDGLHSELLISFIIFGNVSFWFLSGNSLKRLLTRYTSCIAIVLG